MVLGSESLIRVTDASANFLVAQTGKHDNRYASTGRRCFVFHAHPVCEEAFYSVNVVFTPDMTAPTLSVRATRISAVIDI